MPDLCNEIEKFGKGVGSATRYRIIEALFKGPKTVGELVKKSKAIAACSFSASENAQGERSCQR